MVAQAMVERGVSVRQVARQLGVDEGTLRYRFRRSPDAADGRRERPAALDGREPVVTAVLERFGDARVTLGSEARCATRTVFEVLVREFAFRGSYQAVRRYLHGRFGTPPVQVVRRIELPAGVQA